MNLWFKPRDDEGIDHIELTVVDRFKTSELSGDEWRYSVAIHFYRKGILVYEKTYGKMEWAVAALPYELMILPENSRLPLWGLDDKVCNQYGCKEKAVVVYRVKEKYTEQGQGPLPDEPETYRAYCQRHAERGDADREDNMNNYEIVK
jgi:hypothetical protein